MPQPPIANKPTPPASPAPSSRALSRMLGKALRIVVPLGVSAGMIAWLLHETNLSAMMQTVRHGCDFRYVVAAMVMTALSQVIRGARWGIQLRAAGVPRMPHIEESVAIFGAYALNLLVPYLGEGWRCVYVARTKGVKVSVVVGTDLGDRASDAVVVLLLLCLTLVVAHPVMMHFFTHYRIASEIRHLVGNRELWVMAGAVLALVWLLMHLFRQTSMVRRIDGTFDRMWDGFKVLFHMKGAGMYVVLTFGIWICYFLETYLCFFAFPFTRELVLQPGTCWGMVPGLVVFVFGSMSIAVPSNGGLGPWNLAVMFALSLYGVGHNDGVAYSMVVWTCQSITLIALGLFAAAYISRHSRRTAPKKGS